MSKIYKITLDNYCGENGMELYHQSINAKKRFRELCREGKGYDEYVGNSLSCSYFNASYNEYSTYITLEEMELEDLFYDRENENADN